MPLNYNSHFTFMTRRVRAEERAKQEHVSHRTFAVFCVQLDEKDNACAWLEKTIDEREPGRCSAQD